MNREQKTAAIEDISTQLAESSAVFAVDYRGISVPQIATLRTKLREADATFSVVKNTLTELAADKAGTQDLKAVLTGPTALTFVRGDAAMAAKAIAQFIGENQVLEFKGGLMDGAVVTAEEIKAIAKLPSRDVLYGQLVGMIAAPITGLARSLNGLISGLAIQLQQIAAQGLVGQDAPAPAEEPVVEEASEPKSGDGEAAETAASEESVEESADETVDEVAPEAETSQEPEAETGSDEADSDTEDSDK